ncbi:MAG: O-antigen ligase family protein [Chloroflexota bacterium]|nr:O-antigen ligase family protein [Chloroflexota bacterium]
MPAVAIAALTGVALGAAVSLVNPVYALLAIGAAGVVVAVFLLPAGRFWLLAAVISLLPFAVIPINFGVQLTLIDALTAALLGVALVRFLSRGQRGVGTPLDLPILAYLTLSCVSFVFGFGLTAVTGEDTRYFLKMMAAVLLFFALTNGLTSRGMLASFVNALVLGSFASALLADLLQLLGRSAATQMLAALGPLGYPMGRADILRYIAGTTVWRATSTSIDPNIFGGLQMIGIMLLLGRLLVRPSRRGWALAVPMLATMSWALLSSYSRGAWVGLAAGLFFLVLVRYWKALPALVLAAAVVVLAMGSTEFGQHLTSGFRLEDQASAMRVGEYKDAVTFISAYPVFGVGYGYYHQWRTGVQLPGQVYVGVSNIYLLMTLEIGLVGMAGFTAVIGTLGIWAWRRYRLAGAEGKAWIAAGGAALFAAGVAGLADHYFATYPHMAALLWSLIAIVALAARQAEPPSTAQPAVALPANPGPARAA